MTSGRGTSNGYMAKPKPTKVGTDGRAAAHKMLYAHLKEVTKHKAEATNIGKNVTPTKISSKTTGGTLTTTAGANGEFSHNWDDIPD